MPAERKRSSAICFGQPRCPIAQLTLSTSLSLSWAHAEVHLPGNVDFARGSPRKPRLIAMSRPVESHTSAMAC